MTIPSFEIDHTRLNRGIYVSRVDSFEGVTLTTYDIRVCRPYKDKPIPGRVLHTIEHIGAAILRNGPFAKRIVYFGPMGCRTGFYMIMKGEPNVDLATEMMRGVFEMVSEWDEDLPGMTERECGNAHYHDLDGARELAKDFLSHEWHHEYPSEPTCGVAYSMTTTVR